MKKIQCGGFYVDDGAIETREGKPFLKTGGTDPIVENAKQTGGIGWTESGEQTVIHKIDEKYLPEAGIGAMVVEFEFDIHNDSLTASKTVDEVKTAMFTIPVIGVAKAISSGTVVSNTALGCATVNENSDPVFGCYYDTANSHWVEQVGVQDGEWKFAIEK